MTQLQIYNAALAVLGHDQKCVTTTDQTAVCNWLNTFWDEDRQEMLRILEPGFARAYGSLGNPQAITDNQLLQYAYNLPAYCLKLRCVKDQTMMSVAKYDIYQSRIYTNISPATAQYVIDVTDPTKWDSLFTRVMMYKLAVDVSLPLSGAEATKQQMEKGLDAAIRDFRHMDGDENRQTGDPADPNWWVNCRGINRSGVGYGTAAGNYFPYPPPGNDGIF